VVAVIAVEEAGSRDGEASRRGAQRPLCAWCSPLWHQVSRSGVATSARFTPS